MQQLREDQIGSWPVWVWNMGCIFIIIDNVIASNFKFIASSTCRFLCITPKNGIKWRRGNTLTEGANSTTFNSSGYITKVKVKIVFSIVKQVVIARRWPDCHVIAIHHTNMVYTEHAIFVMLFITVVKSWRAKCYRLESWSSQIFSWYVLFTIFELNIPARSQSPLETFHSTVKSVTIILYKN